MCGDCGQVKLVLDYSEAGPVALFLTGVQIPQAARVGAKPDSEPPRRGERTRGFKGDQQRNSYSCFTA